jgi:hypothetical protein
MVLGESAQAKVKEETLFKPLERIKALKGKAQER